MLKERTEFVRTSVYFAELVLLSINFFLVYWFLSHFKTVYELDFFPQWRVVQRPHSIDLYLRAYWLALVIWAVVLRVRAEYRFFRVQTYTKAILHSLVNGFIFFAAFTSGSFILKFDFLSRTFILVYTLASVAVLVVNRFLILSIAYSVRRRGYNYRNLLVVGAGRRAQEFLKLVHKHPEWGFHIIGLMDKNPAVVGNEVGGCRVLGVLEDLPKLLENNVVDEVVFVVPRGWLEQIEKCILYCEAVGVPATLSTDFFNLEIAYGVPKEMDGFTYLTFQTRQLRTPELFVKRVFDILFSSVALVVLSPFFIVAALLVSLTSKGPLFFKQKRCSLNGRVFILYKFRSMVVGSEERLGELQAFNEMKGPVFKMTDDPRLTKAGKFLRRMSLDELPQLWNVLKGDMSLVGPRPPLPSEVAQYEPWQRRRLSMKPGITCIWQISGRNEAVDFDGWMKMDLQYIDRWSLGLDIKILLLTVKEVLTGRGAR